MIEKAQETAEAVGDREIVLSRVVDAPRELVWKVWTEPEHVVNWWGPEGFSTTVKKMDVRKGGVWEHVMRGPDGAEYPNKSVFVEVVKPERIVYSHGGGRQGGATDVSFTVTWTFEEAGPGRTRLTGRMVFPTAEARDRVVKEYGAIEGGKQHLQRLAEYVERLPGNAAVRPFIISRVFDAPRDLVWKAWTEAERLKQWFGPKGFSMTRCKLDFRPGGAFHYCLRMPDGRDMWGRFLFREITPPERMVWVNSFSDEKGGVTRHPFQMAWPLEMLTTVTFAEQGGKTKVTVEWVPLNAAVSEIKTFEEGRGSMKQGWTGTFEQCEAYLAKARGR